MSAAEINDVFYLTRLQTIGLNGLSDLINDTTFNTTFTDSPSLILRAAFNFKASLETVSLDNQIKNILIDDLSNFEKVLGVLFEYPSINTVLISILFSTLVCIFSYITIKKANFSIILHKKIASKLIIIFPLLGIFLLFLNLYINNY